MLRRELQLKLKLMQERSSSFGAEAGHALTFCWALFSLRFIRYVPLVSFVRFGLPFAASTQKLFSICIYLPKHATLSSLLPPIPLLNPSLLYSTTLFDFGPLSVVEKCNVVCRFSQNFKYSFFPASADPLGLCPRPSPVVAVFLPSHPYLSPAHLFTISASCPGAF